MVVCSRNGGDAYADQVRNGDEQHRPVPANLVNWNAHMAGGPSPVTIVTRIENAVKARLHVAGNGQRGKRRRIVQMQTGKWQAKLMPRAVTVDT